jgi:tRNA pseudouridine38-40 synthase
MKNIKLTIEYDGTSYHGWQSQINASAIQDVVCKAVGKLTGEGCKLTGSSRTDTGVHALGQVANFATESGIPADKFSYALNTFLPDDIVIRKSEEVSIDFHARYSAVGKKYRYLIYNSTFPSVLLKHRAWHVSRMLDVGLMRQAAEAFLGKHDFVGFSSTGGSVKTTVRTIRDISVSRGGCFNEASDLIEIQISGDGFLYNMVRIIAGTLVEVGNGKLRPEEMPAIMESLDRKRAGITAPAHGLYLVEVYY